MFSIKEFKEGFLLFIDPIFWPYRIIRFLTSYFDLSHYQYESVSLVFPIFSQVQMKMIKEKCNLIREEVAINEFLIQSPVGSQQNLLSVVSFSQLAVIRNAKGM